LQVLIGSLRSQASLFRIKQFIDLVNKRQELLVILLNSCLLAELAPTFARFPLHEEISPWAR
jgi:hypothetical protein